MESVLRMPVRFIQPPPGVRVYLAYGTDIITPAVGPSPEMVELEPRTLQTSPEDNSKPVWRKAWATCVQHPGLLSEKERSFVSALQHATWITDGQINWLRLIAKRVAAGGGSRRRAA